MSLSVAEEAEFESLFELVRYPRPNGLYPHWSRAQHDRVRVLLRKRHPSVRFAPSTEEMARRFGHRSQRDE